MAERMNQANYHAMIAALYTFGARTAQLSQDLQSAASRCQDILGNEDTGIADICQSIHIAHQHYSQLAMTALHLSKCMAEELKQGELELMLWESD